MPTIAPYGTWKSPISAEMTARDSVGLGAIQLDGERVYWVESRPDEGGRSVIVRREANGDTRDVNPPPYSARTRVHEYGGLCFWAARGAVFFSNYSDGRVYRIADDGEPAAPITPADVDLRYADGMIDARRNRIVCVREDHRGEGEPVNAVIALDLDAGGEGEVLVSGSDFYAYPAVSPDGTALAWLSWNHPNMPWDETELWTADIRADGSLGAPVKVAGARGESVFQPEWSPDGFLHFVSDRTGWWNLYRLRGGGADALAPTSAEFGSPAWTLGARTYAFESAERIACEYVENGAWRLALMDTRTTKLTPVDAPYTEMSRGDIRASAGRVVFGAASPSLPNALVSLNPDGGEIAVLRQSSAAGSGRGLRVVSAGDRVRDGGRRYGAGALLRAAQRRLRSARGRNAAAHRNQPRRTDRRGVHRVRPVVSVLDEPGDSDSGRQLRRQYRVRDGVQAAAERQLGDSGRG